MPPRTRLTQQEIRDHCTAFLVPVTEYVRHKLGDEPADLTGVCLLKALKKYNPARGKLEVYLKTKTYLLVLDALRAQDGRKGTGRNEFFSRQFALEDYDESVVEEPVENEDGLGRVIKMIESAALLQKAILIGQVLGEFTYTDFKRGWNVSESTIHRSVSEIRQSLSVGGLSDAVRGAD